MCAGRIHCRLHAGRRCYPQTRNRTPCPPRSRIPHREACTTGRYPARRRLLRDQRRAGRGSRSPIRCDIRIDNTFVDMPDENATIVECMGSRIDSAGQTPIEFIDIGDDADKRILIAIVEAGGIARPRARWMTEPFSDIVTMAPSRVRRGFCFRRENILRN